MRTRIYSIAAILLAASSFLSSCDEKEQDQRYEEMTEITPQRNVLLEEFTGQMCPNCPKAHQAVAGFKQQYGEHLIAVSIHAGRFAVENEDYPQLALLRPEGNTYADKWGISAYPSGVINRRQGPLSVDDWVNPLRAELLRTTPLQITAQAQYDETSGKVQITVDMESSVALSGKLQVWVTESNIVASQQDGTVLLPEYTHNHVFQACVNGTWGEYVEMTSSVPLQKKYEIVKKDYWKRENLSVVAFVYHETEGVIHVTECPVI